MELSEEFEDNNELEPVITWKDVIEDIIPVLPITVRKRLGDNPISVLRRMSELCERAEENGFRFSTDVSKLKSQVFNCASHQNGSGKSHASEHTKPHKEGKMKESSVGKHSRRSRVSQITNRIKGKR